MSEPENGTRQDRRRGQSLVEVALFLPLLAFMLAGLVEVANLLVTQNKVTTASRIAAGYGATYITDEDRDNWLAPAPIAIAMGDTALNAVTETLNLDEELWDIWSIYGITNDTGEDWAVFTSTQVYGNNAVVPSGDWAGMQAEIQADVLAELQAVVGADTKNMEVVAAADFHNIDTILGLPVWQWVGLHRIRGLTVMRVSEQPPYAGCPILPISVKLNQFTAYPSNWEHGPEAAGGWGQYLRNADGTPVYPNDPIVDVFGPPVPFPPNLFPASSGPNGGWDYPNPPPSYLSPGPGLLDPMNFRANVPGVPVHAAVGQAGLIFRAREEGPAGGFGWLSWDDVNAAPDLWDSLTYPGNFMTKYPGSSFDLGTAPDPPNLGHPDPLLNGVEGDGDGMLEIGEWVANSTGNVASATSIINWYVDTQTPAPLIIFDYTNGAATGDNAAYHVWSFVKVKMLGYSFTGSPQSRWITFEIVSWGLDCIDNE